MIDLLNQQSFILIPRDLFEKTGFYRFLFSATAGVEAVTGSSVDGS